jgi:hypothetical protein
MAYEYLGCDNCGDPEAIESDEDGRFYDGQTQVCRTCGATLSVSADAESCYSRFEYCRHNRTYDEDCIPCEVEGTDIP